MAERPGRLRGWLLNVGLALGGVLVIVLLYGLATRFLSPGANPLPVMNPLGPPEDIVQVAVLNGCGVPGIAADVTRFLRRHDLDVVESGNYADFEQPNSLVIDRVGNRDAALRVAAILGIDEAYVREEVGPDYLVDLSVVIGRDFERLQPFITERTP